MKSTFYIINLNLKYITNVFIHQKKAEARGGGGGKFQWEDNKLIGMSSSTLIASYFVLHITPQQKFVFEPTPELANDDCLELN